MSGGIVRTESTKECIELARGHVLYSLHFIKDIHYKRPTQFIRLIYRTFRAAKNNL